MIPNCGMSRDETKSVLHKGFSNAYCERHFKQIAEFTGI